MLKLLIAPFRWLIRVVLAIVILFEEWGWEPLQRAMAAIGRLPVFRQLEAAVRRLPPYLALVVFFLPGLLLLPIKVAAVWLMGVGRPGLGLAVIVLAKVLGTAVVARIFALTHPALMTLPWFARLYARWTVWKDGLLAWVRASVAWRTARAIKLRIKRALRRGVRSA
ncbi:MAG: hypothetical protein J7598_15580 [Mitsuaria chitosanitabida]|uniref:hypothetical protein n=1 Tax=Roseateles chitosanitabidus TaxID=65048 RepID=UPI001B18E0C2|nr:hypothetical protein [Roseateles chitosanitabidus]MBO9688027.1 hypothetical protein [Roseateles chitosanitabidus]